MSDTYVPLISSGVAGPLGVLHLPRLWQKVSLEEKGKLASSYPGVGKGFDAMTLDALGLEEQAVRDYIKQNKPTYPDFEVWVKKNAKSLNRDAIEKHNAAVRGYNHDDETRRGEDATATLFCFTGNICAGAGRDFFTELAVRRT